MVNLNGLVVCIARIVYAHPSMKKVENGKAKWWKIKLNNFENASIFHSVRIAIKYQMLVLELVVNAKMATATLGNHINRCDPFSLLSFLCFPSFKLLFVIFFLRNFNRCLLFFVMISVIRKVLLLRYPISEAILNAMLRPRIDILLVNDAKWWCWISCTAVPLTDNISIEWTFFIFAHA